MREFFHGWKRKVGCVTLLMACLFTVGWVRSLNDGDVVCVKILGEYFTIRSGNGELQLHHEKKVISITFASKSVFPAPPPNPLLEAAFEWPLVQSGITKPSRNVTYKKGVHSRETDFDRSRFLEKAPWWQTYRVFDKQFYLGNEQRLKDRKDFFGFITLSRMKSDLPQATFSSAYWAIILPMTAVSAWLLFSKPRAKKIESTITPASENA